MATERQIAANRRNAQLSTGPRTPEGKATSSMNALKSGLDAESQFVLGEERADFAALQQEYLEHFQPTTPDQRYQVDRLLRCEWLLRRMFRVESYAWEYHIIRADWSEGVQLGDAWAQASSEFMRIHRRTVHLERSYQEALAELRRSQQNSHAEPVATKEETPKLGSFLKTPAADISTATPSSEPPPARFVPLATLPPKVMPVSDVVMPPPILRPGKPAPGTAKPPAPDLVGQA